MLLSLKKPLIYKERLFSHSCIKPVPSGLEMADLLGGGMLLSGCFQHLAEAEGACLRYPVFLPSKQLVQFGHGTTLIL